ncbi:MAG: iron-sulfur cluster repair di-iron protein [Candidatus Hydrogenedentes bacterium]|nr:iron-sulfur cluster repair di-iron protein [Candidatus Hydrogenedentota bacterium]
MTTIATSTTISELVTERPSRSRLFERLGIDYCCAGKMTVAEACAKKSLDPQDLIEMITTDDAESVAGDQPDCAAMTQCELVEHILATHHANLIRELPRLGAMSEKVAKVHGAEDPRLIEVQRVFRGFADEMDAHKAKEERILFPAICRIEQGDSNSGACFGSVSNPIRVMEAEHEGAGQALARMRELTDDYTPPEWACNTYRALLHGLHELEIDTHIHVHKENYILFPRAIEAESQLAAGCA